MTSAALAHRRRWLALVLLSAAQFLVVLDASIVNVALPSIQDDLGFSEENLQWVVNAYVLTFGGFLLLGGRAADLFGRRRVFLGGLVLFALASLAGGLASSQEELIAARAVQGIGAAIISPAALSILMTTFAEGKERTTAMGVWGAVAGAGGAVGVLMGGILTDSLGWEWVLFVNVPIALAAAAAVPTLLAESRAPERHGFDLAGALSVTAGLALFIYTIVETVNEGWTSARTLAGFAVSALLIVAFVLRELTARQPLVRLAIFRKRTLTASNVVGLLVGASLFSMFFFISLYLQRVLGYSAMEAGLAYLPLAVTIFLSAGGASTLVQRVRRAAGDGHRAALRRDRPDPVRPGPGRGLVRGRRPGAVAAGGGRARVLVRLDHAGRDDRGRGPRVRTRLRADQHVAAGGRRAGPGRPVDAGHRPHRGPRGERGRRCRWPSSRASSSRSPSARASRSPARSSPAAVRAARPGARRRGGAARRVASGGDGGPRRTLRPLAHRHAAPRQPADRAAGLAVRPVGRRAVPHARRGPRPRPRRGRSSSSEQLDDLAALGHRLGRRGRAPVRARRRSTPRRSPASTPTGCCTRASARGAEIREAASRAARPAARGRLPGHLPRR